MKLHWKPSDGAEVTRMGVPLALTTYQFVSAQERAFYSYLCTLADRDGVVMGVGQKAMTARFEIDRRTLSRWIATLTRLRMLYAEQPGHQELAVYTLRAPSCWIAERAKGQVSPEELEAHFGPAHRPKEAIWEREQARRAKAVPSDGTFRASDVPSVMGQL